MAVWQAIGHATAVVTLLACLLGWAPLVVEALSTASGYVATPEGLHALALVLLALAGTAAKLAHARAGTKTPLADDAGTGVMSIPMTGYDAALREANLTYTVRFDGRLDAAALRAGLAKTLQANPLLAGRVTREPDGTRTLHAPLPGSPDTPLFPFATREAPGPCPHVQVMSAIRAAGCLHPMGASLAFATATYFPLDNRSLLVFCWRHQLMDFPSAFGFLHSWLSCAAHGCDAAANVAVSSAAKGLSDAAWAADEFTPDSKAGQRFLRLPFHASPASDASAEGMWPPAVEGDSHSSRLASLAWLQQHKASCPFPCDPLNGLGHLGLMLKGVAMAALFTRVVRRVPRSALDAWKRAAAAARPLPKGVHYSAGTALAAMLAATLYQADRRRYDKQGGLYVAFIVNVRGGRAGMAVPAGNVGNASLWAPRIWVPAAMLATAGGQPSPELMHHLRTSLHTQLHSTNGQLHRQMAFYEAYRRAGVAGKLCGTMLGAAWWKGDITIDLLPHAASDLPTVQGAVPATSALRMLDSPYFTMAVPTRSEAPGSPGNDLVFDVMMTSPVARAASAAWAALGVSVEATPPYPYIVEVLSLPEMVQTLGRNTVLLACELAAARLGLA